MKIYSLRTVLSFGKNTGKTLEEILLIDQSYLDWCLINLEHFTLLDETLEEIKQINPEFILTEEANKNRLNKLQTYIDQQESCFLETEKKKRNKKNITHIKIYQLDTKFGFGNFNDRTLREVLFSDPNYINWCLINLEHFYLMDQTIEEIKKLNPKFILSDEADLNRLKKYMDWMEREARNEKYYSQDSNSSFRDFGYESIEEMENDILFEGDSTNYWNID